MCVCLYVCMYVCVCVCVCVCDLCHGDLFIELLNDLIGPLEDAGARLSVLLQFEVDALPLRLHVVQGFLDLS